MVTENQVRRVRSIVFDHDGSRWTAEVGKPIRVQRPSRDRRKARYGVMEPERVMGDVPTEIRPGNPWLVYLHPDHFTRYWVNPFYVGESSIHEVAYFEAGAGVEDEARKAPPEAQR